MHNDTQVVCSSHTQCQPSWNFQDSLGNWPRVPLSPKRSKLSQKLFMWQSHNNNTNIIIKWKSDRDGMLAGSRSVQATGWMPQVRVQNHFPRSEQARVLTWSKYLTQNLPQLNSRLEHCHGVSSCKSKQNPAKWVTLQARRLILSWGVLSSEGGPLIYIYYRFWILCYIWAM